MFAPFRPGSKSGPWAKPRLLAQTLGAGQSSGRDQGPKPGPKASTRNPTWDPTWDQGPKPGPGSGTKAAGARFLKSPRSLACISFLSHCSSKVFESQGQSMKKNRIQAPITPIDTKMTGAAFGRPFTKGGRRPSAAGPFLWMSCTYFLLISVCLYLPGQNSNLFQPQFYFISEPPFACFVGLAI